MPGRYALIIGNSQYTDRTLQRLITPVQDVEALAYVLKKPAIGDFDVNVKSDVRSHQLRLEIERFFAKRKPTDTLLFYFSGHGVIEDYSGELYLFADDRLSLHPPPLCRCHHQDQGADDHRGY